MSKNSFFNWRLLSVLVAIGGLALVFIFQDKSWLSFFSGYNFHPHTQFIVRKVSRVILNDSLMLLLIHAWFHDRSITRLAGWLQLVDMLVLLPAYLALKLVLEGDSEISSPLLSQLHRLIVNPTIMVLLIPAIYFQRFSKHRNG